MSHTTSLFLYGTLRHLPLLDVVLGRAPETRPARLDGYRVMAVAGESFPAIREAAGGVAEGIVLEVSEAERARLDFYEGAYHFALAPVTVETASGPEPAQIYLPAARVPAADGPWDFEGWVARLGASVTAAAGEVMALMGQVTADEAGRRYPTILLRAEAAIRAVTEPAPEDVRQGPGAEAVEVRLARQPYANYFAVAEHDLRHPRFGGGLSETVTRAAFVMGDAVTVLPYDPARDRVLVIEQFRFGPFARGDTRPWALEPVAGRIDPGEAPEAAARRETQEEAGLAVGDLHHVASYYVSPGAVTEFLYSYVGIAEIPDGAGGIGGMASEDEDILGHVLSFDRLMELVRSGEAGTAPLILTAQWLALNRDRLRADKTASRPAPGAA